MLSSVHLLLDLQLPIKTAKIIAKIILVARLIHLVFQTTPLGFLFAVVTPN